MSLLSAKDVRVPGRLAPVSLELQPGTVHALVGGNGSGKSTFLDCVLGLVPFEGALALKSPTVAVVPQRLELATSSPLTVLELFGASTRQRPSWLGLSTAFRARTVDALKVMEAETSIDQQLETLSGGALRRVLLALAFSAQPALLLLDEPEAGLDVRARALLATQLTAAKARGQAVLWVSHDDAAVTERATSQTRLVAP